MSRQPAILLAALFAALSATLCAQAPFALVHRGSGDTLWLDPARVVRVETAEAIHSGELASHTSWTLTLRTGMTQGRWPQDTLVTVTVDEVVRIGYCRLKDIGQCGRLDERRTRSQRWTHSLAAAAMVGGGLVAFSGDGRLGGALTLAGGLFYVGALVAQDRPVRRIRLGKRWRWA